MQNTLFRFWVRRTLIFFPFRLLRHGSMYQKNQTIYLWTVFLTFISRTIYGRTILRQWILQLVAFFLNKYVIIVSTSLNGLQCYWSSINLIRSSKISKTDWLKIKNHVILFVLPLSLNIKHAELPINCVNSKRGGRSSTKLL